MASTINASTTGGGGLIQSADASGVLQLQTAGTTAITIAASKSVSVGTAVDLGIGNLYVSGSIALGADIYESQPTPTALTATATLTIAQMLTNIVTVTSATAVTLTLPTGTLTDAGIIGGLLPVNGSFDWSIINLGSASGAITIAAGTAHTYVGNATQAITTSAWYRTRKTAANTFVTYRIGS